MDRDVFYDLLRFFPSVFFPHPPAQPPTCFLSFRQYVLVLFADKGNDIDHPLLIFLLFSDMREVLGKILRTTTWY